jgi:hypothetical protein
MIAWLLSIGLYMLTGWLTKAVYGRWKIEHIDRFTRFLMLVLLSGLFLWQLFFGLWITVTAVKWMWENPLAGGL